MYFFLFVNIHINIVLYASNITLVKHLSVRVHFRFFAMFIIIIFCSREPLCIHEHFEQQKYEQKYKPI